MALITYPLNNVEYTAEDAEIYNATRMSGVWSGMPFDYELIDGTNTIKVGAGLAWINNGDFTGKAIASKEEQTFDFGIAPTAQSRIDVLAIQFSSVDNETRFVIKTGTPSSNPSIPEIEQGSSVYELYLFYVTRRSGAASILASDIRDLRDNRDYCGYMQDAIKGGYAPSLMEHNKGDDFRFWVGTKAAYEKQQHNMKPNMFCVVTNEDEIGDYVVGRGTTGNWNYTKWNSGVVECIGKYAYDFSNNFEELKHGYIRYLTTPLPADVFNNVPTAGIASVDVAGSVGVRLFASTKDSLSLVMNTAVPYDGAENSCTISLHLIGTWK